jgi:hypothetical protein
MLVAIQLAESVNKAESHQVEIEEVRPIGCRLVRSSQTYGWEQ